MKSYPIIKDVHGDFSGPCDCPGADKLLHNVHRQVRTRSITNEGNADALLDEAGFPILDELTGNLIFDDYPHTLVS